MGIDMEFFTNDRYKLLRLLRDSEIEDGDYIYISMTQQEMADKVGFSKLKVNRIVNELIDKDYIGLHQGKRGKYVVLESGDRVLEKIKSNKIITIEGFSKMNVLN